MPGNAVNTQFIQTNTIRFKQAAVEPVFIRADVAVPAEQVIVKPEETVVTRPLIDPVDLSVHVAEIKYFKPELSALLSGVTPATEGVARAALTVPVSATEVITDEQFFEDAVDPAKKYYLPRYRIHEIDTTAGKQFDIRLKQSSSGGILEIKLEKYPAPSIGGADAAAKEIKHLISILLQFDVGMQGGGSMQKEIPFADYTNIDVDIRATLTVNSMTQFIQVYQAMTESSYNARLIVRRVIEVAIPVTSPPPVNTGIIPDTYWKAKPIVTYTPRLIVAGAENTAVAPDVVLTLYHQTSRPLDVSVPFTFPVALQGYIFKDIATSGNQTGPGLQRHQVADHLYYQDMVQPGVFYYLPDSFKIARRPAPPFAPFMCVSFSGDGSLEKTNVTIEYVAIPFTDSIRINTAEPELKKSLDAGQEIRFMPLIAHASFTLALPGTAGGLSGPYQERTGAMVELREGIHDSVTLSLKNFQLLYDALMGASQTLFTGNVNVSVTDQDKIHIPFSARMNDLAGDVCTIRQQYDATAGKGNVVIRNEIESPLTIRSIRIMLNDGGVPVPFKNEGADLTASLSLTPMQEAMIGIVPLEAGPMAKPLEIKTVLSELETQPDKEAIWKAILNPYTPIEYERTIVVETFIELFTADPQASSDTSLKAIIVNFFNGTSVTLKPAALQANATVNVSLSNYILGKVDTREYKYQVEVVTLAGKLKIGPPGEWITDQADDLFITKDLIS